MTDERKSFSSTNDQESKGFQFFVRLCSTLLWNLCFVIVEINYSKLKPVRYTKTYIYNNHEMYEQKKSITSLF